MASFYSNHPPVKPNDQARPLLPPPPPPGHYMPPQPFQPPYPPPYPQHHPHNPGYPPFPTSGYPHNLINSSVPAPQAYPSPFPPPPPNFPLQPPNSFTTLPPPPPWTSSHPPNAASANPNLTLPAANSSFENPNQTSSKPVPQTSSEPKSASKNPSQRVETEEERRQRKKREYENQKKERERRKREERQEKEKGKEKEKEKQKEREKEKGHPSQNAAVKSNQIKQSQSSAIKSSKFHEKTIHSEMKSKASNASHTGNHLNRPSTFLCKINFHNELPSFTSQPKLLKINNDSDRYSRYSVTGEEKNSKHRLHVEMDLGIPLDLLDMSVYNAPPPHLRPPLDEADEALLKDITPSMMNDSKSQSVKVKSRPTDKGLNWLIHTQYISTIDAIHTTKKLSEKEERMLSLLEENDVQTKESQIKSIESSFSACKQKPVHPTNPNLEPVEILPILPNFDRMGEKFVQIGFDSDPMSELSSHRSLDDNLKEKIETKAILQNFRLSGKNSNAIVGCMLPKIDEIGKSHKIDEEIEYEWLREYLWTFSRADSHVFCFNESNVTYVPVESKLNIHKRKAKEGKEDDYYNDDEQKFNNEYPIPSQIKVKRRRMSEEEERIKLRNKNLLLEGTDLETEEAADVVREAIEAINGDSEEEREEEIERVEKERKKNGGREGNHNREKKRGRGSGVRGKERYDDSDDDDDDDKDTYGEEDEDEGENLTMDVDERRYQRRRN